MQILDAISIMYDIHIYFGTTAGSIEFSNTSCGRIGYYSKYLKFKFKFKITLLLYETSNSLQLQNALHMEHNTE